tara:strand:- start:378 stop:1562 length:1185 start_codon:yes stop_codon:yes gene_type:complete
MNIGVFEPVLALSLLVLVYHVMVRKISVDVDFPWRIPLVVFAVWQFIGLFWAYQASTGIQEVVAVAIILTTATLLIIFVDTKERFVQLMIVWVAASVLVGVLSMATNFTEVSSTGQTWEIAEQGGRETGLGQQPNWFAMNLMFGVLTSFALAVYSRRRLYRVGFVIAGLIVFYTQLRSGSRGGMYSIVIGCGAMGLGNAIFRKWIVRFLAFVAILFAVQITFGDESTRKAFMRIWMNLDTLWGSDVRGRNWLACVHMFQDTWGRGIGAGGYATLIADYDWKIYSSIHRYPHGILWGLLAHYGVIGVFLFGVIVVRVKRMASETVAMAKGTRLEGLAWSMPATMLGYFIWSFIEFNFDDKPFWEFLALYTALYLILKRDQEDSDLVVSGEAEVAS